MLLCTCLALNPHVTIARHAKLKLYHIVGYFRGGNFLKFHELKTICVNFTLKMLTFQWVLLIIRDDS